MKALPRDAVMERKTFIDMIKAATFAVGDGNLSEASAFKLSSLLKFDMTSDVY